jgi:hypothetical protein
VGRQRHQAAPLAYLQTVGTTSSLKRSSGT